MGKRKSTVESQWSTNRQELQNLLFKNIYLVIHFHLFHVTFSDFSVKQAALYEYLQFVKLDRLNIVMHINAIMPVQIGSSHLNQKIPTRRPQSALSSSFFIL